MKSRLTSLVLIACALLFAPAEASVLQIEVQPGEPDQVKVSVSPATLAVDQIKAVTVEAQLLDKHGNRVEKNELFVFTVEEGHFVVEGEKKPKVLEQWGEGIARAQYLPPANVANQIVQVKAASLQGRGVLTVVPGKIATLSVQPETHELTADGKATTRVFVRAYDKFGNPARGGVHLQASQGKFVTDAGVFPETSVAVVEGVGTGTYQAGEQAGTVELVASAEGVSARNTLLLAPGPLARIAVYPASVVVEAGAEQKFTAEGFDAAGNRVPIFPTWGIVGEGEISPGGVFRATSAGKTVVLASYEDIVGQSQVRIIASGPEKILVTPKALKSLPRETTEITMAVSDRFGNLVPRTKIIVWSDPPFSSLPRKELFTNDTGELRLEVAAPDKAGLYKVYARGEGLVEEAVSLEVIPDKPARIVLRANPPSLGEKESTYITAQVHDRFGNLVADGTEVHLVTTFGSFENQKTTATVSTRAGVATIRLDTFLPFEEIVVTASAENAPPEELVVRKRPAVEPQMKVPEPFTSQLTTPAPSAMRDDTIPIPLGNRIAELSVKDADLQDVIRVLARKSGLNLVADESVEGKITLELRDFYARDALQYIFAIKNLGYKRIGSGILIFSKGWQAGQQKVDIIHVKNNDASKVKELLSNLIGETVQVKVDPQMNALVVSGPARGVGEMRELVAMLDSPARRGLATEVFVLRYADPEGVKQILESVGIGTSESAKILVYSPQATSLKEKGVEQIVTPGLASASPTQLTTAPSQALVSQSVVAQSVGVLGTSANLRDLQGANKNMLIVQDTEGNVRRARELIAEIDKPAPQVILDVRIEEVDADALASLGVQWDNQLKANFKEQNEQGKIGVQSFARSALAISSVLNLLQSQDKSRTLSSPRLTTVDGKRARIHIGDTIPIKEEQTIITPAGVVEKTVTFTPLNVGILLDITPRISDDGYISTNIFTQVSTAEFKEGSNEPPVVKARTADTFVRIKEGETIVLGGLISNEEVERLSKVPLLADVPALGQLFQHRRKSKRKTELVILLTPHIVHEER